MWPFKKKHVCEYEITHASKEQQTFNNSSFSSGLVTGFLCLGKCTCGQLGAWVETQCGPRFIVDLEWTAIKLNIDPITRV